MIREEVVCVVIGERRVALSMPSFFFARNKWMIDGLHPSTFSRCLFFAVPFWFIQSITIIDRINRFSRTNLSNLYLYIDLVCWKTTKFYFLIVFADFEFRANTILRAMNWNCFCDFFFAEHGRLVGSRLTFRIVNYPKPELHPNLDNSQLYAYVDHAVYRAIKVFVNGFFLKLTFHRFSMWSEHIDVEFEPMADENQRADVEIAFARREHGDEYPFDGTGNEVGHAFYPNNANRHGQVHVCWVIVK